jgi:hypothetical protein
MNNGTCTKNTCTGRTCGGKPASHLAFFVAVFAIVAIGVGSFSFLNAEIVVPINEAQAAEFNPGLTQLHRKKMNAARITKTENKAAASASSENR